MRWTAEPLRRNTRLDPVFRQDSAPPHTHTHRQLGGGGCRLWFSVLMQLVADERGRKREEGWAK